MKLAFLKDEPRLPALGKGSPARAIRARGRQLSPCARALPGPTFAPSPSWGAVPSASSPREQTKSSHIVVTAPRALQTHMKGPAPVPRGLRSESVTHTNNIRDKGSQFSAMHRRVCEVPANHALRPRWHQSKRQHFPRLALARPRPGGTPRVRGVRSQPSVPLPRAGTAHGPLAALPDFSTQQHTSVGTSELQG